MSNKPEGETYYTEGEVEAHVGDFIRKKAGLDSDVGDEVTGVSEETVRILPDIDDGIKTLYG